MEAATAQARTTDRHPSASLLVQGSYYVVTGLWPLLHRRSFEALTGKKHDHFLLDTGGALFVAIGASLLAAAKDGGGSGARALAVATPTAASLATLRHRRRLRPVYYADALLQWLLGTWSLRAGR